jgi:hypothetical protein
MATHIPGVVSNSNLMFLRLLTALLGLGLKCLTAIWLEGSETVDICVGLWMRPNTYLGNGIIDVPLLLRFSRAWTLSTQTIRQNNSSQIQAAIFAEALECNIMFERRRVLSCYR